MKPRSVTSWSDNHRGRVLLEIVLSLAAGIVAFVVAALVCTAARGRIPSVIFGAMLLLAVLAVARFGGILYALPVGVVTVQAFDWYFLPPLRRFDWTLVFVLSLFLVVSVIVAVVTVEAGRRTSALEQARGDLADEQAALRRVATLVASGAEPDAVFTAVADELGRLIGADATLVSRVDRAPDGAPETSVTVVGCYGVLTEELPVGSRVELRGGMAMSAAVAAGETTRITGRRLRNGPLGPVVARLGLRAAVVTPVVVGGRRWGVTVATTVREDFPPGTEARVADFMELAATAVANAQADQRLLELADTQASLRRLAMLVARGETPDAVFAAVGKEVLRHFGDGTARLIRFERDGTATLVANEGTSGPHVRVGEPWVGYPPTGLTATVRRTGEAARVDDYGDVPGGDPYLREGIRSAVAVPIHAEGRLWGIIAVGSGIGPLPPDTEQRLSDFTDLIATAVANAQSRAELMTSRARLVAAADDARRRIERDLHDGAQQRLVTLALGLRSGEAAASGTEEIKAEIEEATDELVAVIEELREISRGIHPAILSESGLGTALLALGRRSPVPVELDVRIDGRLPESVEVAAYYVVAEMLTNAAKHAEASVVEVSAEASDGRLVLRVRDDGIGGADPARGSGLLGLKDRVEALGGTFVVDSPPGLGTTASCELPISADRAATAVSGS